MKTRVHHGDEDEAITSSAVPGSLEKRGDVPEHLDRGPLLGSRKTAYFADQSHPAHNCGHNKESTWK